MRIGLFDSGMGGLTVLRELRKRYPLNEYVYFGDNLHNPYGDKSMDELLVLADKNIKFLIEKGVQMIIIACGTVSSNCFDKLKNKYNIPIYNIISPTIDYLNNSDCDNILVIATKATINSHIFKKNILKNVYEIEIQELAPLIENDELENIDDILHNYLDKYVNKVDTIVLGCTHYPIIMSNIKGMFPNANVIDMASVMVTQNGDKEGLELYFSKVSKKITSRICHILGVSKVDVNLVNND